MVLRISELKLHPDHTEAELEREIRKAVHLPEGALEYEILRQSIDARKKPELFYVYTVDVTVKHPEKWIKKIRNKKVSLVEKKEYHFPCRTISGDSCGAYPPVIVGSGPAGLFCALMLARCGMKPIVLERGESVDQRVETVKHFWETGALNPESNVQFGEGGAGTFSDGKLNTTIKDPEGKIRFVLKEFVRAGASDSILYHHKPHIGTDVLVEVVRTIRNEIIARGGEFRFGSCLTGIGTDMVLCQDDRTSQDEEADISAGKNSAARYHLEINGQKDVLLTNHLVLALGHSARDTFQMLYDMGLPMQAKSFAVGFRMEHSQQMINDAMYGKECTCDMGAAPYKVTHKCGNGRGVYSFCMCPGGYVVNASSEKGMTAVNGMSYSGRDSANANSAIVVTVSPEDYRANHPLSGIEFQRTLERAAYECGNGKIPLQRFEDFCNHRVTDHLGSVKPQCKGQFAFADLNTILPDELNASIIEGIRGFGRRIRGFDDPDALLSGVESRTSSPVRILRDEDCQSAFPGIYPCGEGAGYAGGITSAAVDGIRVAEAVCRGMR